MVTIIEGARIRVAEAVNSEMVLAYWLIGREIVQYIQQGSARADYGERVIEGLSVQLQADVGQGYSVRNLRYFRRFYLVYANRTPCTIDSRSQFGTSLVPNCHDEPEGFSSRLSWSHYRALTTVNEAAARAFYEIEAAREGWSVPNLERQIHTQLHLRLLKSRDKEGVLSLARRGQAVERPVDLIKSPVVLSEHKRLFAAKYVTCLPTEEELRQELERDRRIAESLVRAKGRRGSTKRASEARKRSRSE